MDLSFRTIHDVVHPTAAFASEPEGKSDGADGDPREGSNSWELSQLNPKNRVDSLDDLQNPLWRIDGSTGLGTQFYATPLFLADIPPMRLDVFIYEGASYPPLIRSLLNLDQAFHTKDAERVRRLGIARHISRILQRQTQLDAELGVDIVRELYYRGPFGSRITIEHLSLCLAECRIRVHYNHALERDLLSYRDLVSLWKGDEREGGGAEIPPQLGIDHLSLIQQLHDSISLVRVKVAESPTDEHPIQILKAVTSEVKYMYHELHALLFRVPAGPNTMARPTHIITKQCLFGTKRGVIGFTLPYHPAGSLRDALPLLRIHEQLGLTDQIRWARQVATALSAVWNNGFRTFYPDLRLDNIVLSASRDVVLVDFEQRGVWSGFSSPEVEIFETIRIIALDDTDSEFGIPEAVQEQFKAQLADYLHMSAEESLERLVEEPRYTRPGNGYNLSWLCLSEQEQEASMVYMLGRVLWCIFEGMSAPHRGAIWQSYRREPEVEFPRFYRTPPDARSLIQRCLGPDGARELCQFVRVGSKVWFKKEKAGDPIEYNLMAEHVPAQAKAYWTEQLRKGDEWLKDRRRRREDGSFDGRYGRPTLETVASELQALERKHATDET